MLAKFTDKDGDPVWINAIHVRSVMIGTGLLGGHKGTQVMLSSDNIHGHRVFVRETPSAVAIALNNAITQVSPLVAISAEEDKHHRSDNSFDDASS